MGRAAPPLYGLDIETDTSTDGLDPGVAGILAVALSTEADGDTVFTGSEAAVLRLLDDHLADLEPGVLVTWNGAAFDLPFLADRAVRHRVALGLDLLWDPSAARPGRQPLPGHIGSYVARWWSHGHVDAYRAWRHLTDDPDESCALKAVARREGFEPVEVDRAIIHETPLHTLRRYASSDASLARQLAAHRWGDIRRFVDHLPDGGQLALAFRA
ncbi:MAG TPA: ribonuclease H-like domain-containing protein [Acidimicrobiales bacterium]